MKQAKPVRTGLLLECFTYRFPVSCASVIFTFTLNLLLELAT
jgi:hypothetical protein